MSDDMEKEFLEERDSEVFAALLGSFVLDYVMHGESSDDEKTMQRVFAAEQRFHVLKKTTQSPIEKIMAAILASSHDGFQPYAVLGVDAEDLPEKDFRTYVEPQAVLEVAGKSYRADFLLHCYAFHGVVRRAVVECDGHEFHERTKEQAARDRQRDRSLTNAGYAVFRFTGSELFRYPYRVSEELSTAISNLLTP